MITLDTSAVLALYDPRDAEHERAVAALAREAGGRIVPAEILSEIDHMVRRRLRHPNPTVGLFLSDLVSGRAACDCACDERLPRIVELLARYEDLGLDLADAAVIACAEANGGRVLTLDRRDFDVIAGEGRLTVLP